MSRVCGVGGSYQIFLRNPIATCAFPEWGPDPCPIPWASGSAHGFNSTLPCKLSYTRHLLTTVENREGETGAK